MKKAKGAFKRASRGAELGRDKWKVEKIEKAILRRYSKYEELKELKSRGK